ncbi:uncharacterized protein LOC21406326 [Morus notabilis]|uniref:uncharacterized protein LOC21406326 n=1 Tax=Morus notabilis TaxID=981085 RepID=UPI000CED0772|nr:uncharacterized protein LOC21406326 [Morus notabilis]
MVSLGDDNGGNNDPIKPDSPFVTSDQPFDTSDGETQLFDSQSWSPEYIGGGMEEVGHGDDLLQSTMLLDDTEMVEDAFETQMVDLAGETQVTDFGGETQEADICGETQVLDDDNCFEHMETQLLDDYGNEDVSDSDGEGSDATEVLGDKDDLTDDFLVGEGECHSVDKKKGQFFLVCNNDLKLIEQPNGASHQQNNGGFHVPIATPVPQSFVTAKSGACSSTS